MASTPHRRHSPQATPPRPADATTQTPWAPCPTCWGQRRILHAAPNGEGLVPRTCPGCLGVGERPLT